MTNFEYNERTLGLNILSNLMCHIIIILKEVISLYFHSLKGERGHTFGFQLIL